MLWNVKNDMPSALNLQVRQQPSLQRVTLLRGLALFGGHCFNLALTGKLPSFLGRLYAKEWGIFECFFATFCGSEDGIVLFNDTVKVEEARVISGKKDRSISQVR